MAEKRIIKKYPNRRLYDTTQSRYITLASLRELVMKGEEFQVIDTHTDEDLTRSILLQIMFEEESGGQPLFSTQMLSQIIRFYGGTVQGLFAKYLEESLSMFTQQQDKFTGAVGGDPVSAMTEMARRNMDMWSEMQKSFLSAAGIAGKKEQDKDQ